MGSIAGQISLEGRPVAPPAGDALVWGRMRAAPVHRGESGWLADMSGRDPAVQAGAPGCQVAFDGALHDVATLHAALQAAGLPAGPGETGSGETGQGERGHAGRVARAWQAWGPDFPDRLTGDFALALLEPAERRAILVADHIGSRPLYWTCRDGVLSFATFLPVLLAILPERPPIDEAVVASYLHDATSFEPLTFFDGIRSLRPGHAVVADASGVRETRWWQPEKTAELHLPGQDDYVDAFVEIVETAIRDRIDATVRPGAHISGGIDSTTVTVIAQDMLKARGQGLIAGYSWSPDLGSAITDLGEKDERHKIARICAARGIPLRFGATSGEQFRDFHACPIELEGIADLVDELRITELAEDDGIDMLLSGWGGDEAFSFLGHSLPAWRLKTGRIGRVLRDARAHGGGLRRPDGMARFVWQHSVVPLLPDALFWRFINFTGGQTGNPYAAARLAAMPPPPDRNPRLRFVSDPRRQMIRAFDHGHLAMRMRSWAAWGAQRGFDYRYPLLDKRLLTFLQSVPRELLMADGYSRFLARKTLRRYSDERLTKNDPANEAKRLAARRACWELLGREVGQGLYGGSCDWLDMDALRAGMRRGPSGEDTADIQDFAKISTALRVWHMARRNGAVSGEAAAPDMPQAIPAQ